MYIGNVEVTGREVLLAVSMAAIALIVGFSITASIQQSADDKSVKYSRALRITEQEELEDAISIKYGYILAEGDAVALNTITCDYLTGEYAAIEIHKEVYEQTTHVTTDSKGNTQTTITTDWEHRGSTQLSSNSIYLLGQNFNGENFGLASHTSGLGAEELSNQANQKYKYSGRYLYERDSLWTRLGDVRYSFSVVPTSFHCTLFANTAIEDFTFDTGGLTLYYEQNTEQVLDYVNNLGESNSYLFWVVWGMIVVVGVLGFVSLENYWLHN